MTIKTNSQFHQTVNDIAVLQTRLRALEAERDEEIQRIQKKHGAKIEEAEEGIKERIEAAAAYAETHQDELLLSGKGGLAKSAETPLARYGFRTGNPTVKPLNRKWSAQAILDAVKRVLGLDYVITDEKIAKERLRVLPEDTLARVGLRVEQAESFWVEAKVEGAEHTSA